MPALFFLLLIVAAWDVTKTAVRHTGNDYGRSRDSAVREAEKEAGGKASLPKPKRNAVVRRHKAGYMAGEILHGFPVTRTGWHAGWLAHGSARAQAKAIREEARTTNAETRASFLQGLREHRQRQEEARRQIEAAVAAAPGPVRGKEEVGKAAANVLPFPRRNPDDAPPLPADGVGGPHPEPGPYAVDISEPVVGYPKEWERPGGFVRRAEDPRPDDDGAAHLRAPMPDPRLNDAQRQRDADPRLRDACAACGRPGIAEDPLVVHPDGYRVHESHTTDPSDGLYIPPADDNWPTGIPHRRNGDAPSPATNGGTVMTADTTYRTVLDSCNADVAACDQDQATIRARKDAAYRLADEMTAANVDPAVIDEQMAKAAAYEQAEQALTQAGEHSGTTATLAQQYHGQMQAAVDDAPGRVAERQFHEGS
jgi:hypothetical protein